MIKLYILILLLVYRNHLFCVCVVVINFDGQLYGLRTCCARRLRCFLQPPEQFINILHIFVQIVQDHQQQRVHGGPRTESDGDAENVVHEEKLRRRCSHVHPHVPFKCKFSYLIRYYSTINISSSDKIIVTFFKTLKFIVT